MDIENAFDNLWMKKNWGIYEKRKNHFYLGRIYY